MRKRELDLALVIHGVVIGNGFWNFWRARSDTQLFYLALALLISISDWYSFYYIESKIDRYPFLLLFVDFVILGIFVKVFNLPVSNGFNEHEYWRFLTVISILFLLWWLEIFCILNRLDRKIWTLAIPDISLFLFSIGV